MGDGVRDRERATLAKARMELEELYQGIPDDSVNLTFQDLADVQLHRHPPIPNNFEDKTAENATKLKTKNKEKNKPPSAATALLDPISDGVANSTPSTSIINSRSVPASPIESSPPNSSFQCHSHHDGNIQVNKVPSLDFSRALRAYKHHHRYQHNHDQTTIIAVNDGDHMTIDDSYASSSGHHRHHHITTQLHAHHHDQHRPDNNNSFDHHGGYDTNGMTMSSTTHQYHHSHGHGHSNTRMMVSNMAAYEDVSIYSKYGPQTERSAVAGVVGRRCPGIPHSNICAVCTTYIYIFRHRCLVCGRVYCRQCVSMGMGEMTEGRKCIECLGRRFSIRYIHKAGKVGCVCFGFEYGSQVKQAELKWAEKGPRRSGERVGYGRSNASMMSTRTRTPMGPRSPLTEAHSHSAIGNSNPPSFVTGSPYSPAAHRHYLPF